MQMPCRQGETLVLSHRAEISKMAQFHKKKAITDEIDHYQYF